MTKENNLLEIIRSNFAALVKLNLLFLLACLPMITIGPAIITLFELTGNMINGSQAGLWRDAKIIFCRRFKVGVLFGALAAGFLWLWLFAVRFYLYALSENPLYGLMLAGVFMTGMAVLSVGIYFLTLVGTRLLSTKASVRYAALLAVAKPLPVIGAIAIIGCGLILLYNFTLQLFPLFLIVGCSGVALCVLCLVIPTIETLIIAPRISAQD